MAYWQSRTNQEVEGKVLVILFEVLVPMTTGSVRTRGITKETPLRHWKKSRVRAALYRLGTEESFTDAQSILLRLLGVRLQNSFGQGSDILTN